MEHSLLGRNDKSKGLCKKIRIGAGAAEAGRQRGGGESEQGGEIGAS